MVNLAWVTKCETPRYCRESDKDKNWLKRYRKWTTFSFKKIKNVKLYNKTFRSLDLRQLQKVHKQLTT